MHTASQYRTYARNALKGRWGGAVLVTLIASIFGVGNGGGFLNIELPGNLEETVSPVPENFFVMSQEQKTEFAQNQMNKINEIANELTNKFFSLPHAVQLGIEIGVGLAIITSIAYWIISRGIDLGHRNYYIKMCRGEFIGTRTLFTRIGLSWKGVGLAIVSGLFIFLWSLLFIIPGIIAAFRYSMAPYIMAQNPDIGIMEALRESKRIMHGHKFDLFVLNLSFIGWMFVCVFTCGIGYLFLSPYMEAANAAFYLDVSGQFDSYNRTETYTASAV